MIRREIIGVISIVAVIGTIIFLPAFLPVEDRFSAGQPKLLRFQSHDELLDFLKRSDYSPPFYSGGPWFEAASDGEGSIRQSAPSPDYSKTNIQVEGVDEADIVKCDGEYVYLASDSEVLIVKAYPAEEAEVLAEIELKGTIRGIFVDGDKLVVFTDKFFDYKRVEAEDYVGPIVNEGSQAVIRVYDIGDRGRPFLARNVSVDGVYLDSRMIGNYVYALTSSQAYIIEEEVLLPSLIHNGDVEEIEASSIYYSNVSDYYYAFTTIVAFNVQDDGEDVVHETFLIGSASCIYVSLDNVYLTIPKYGGNYREETEIHRISVEDGKITYEAGGGVPGYVLNQFSMDEQDPYFRIATTTGHVSRTLMEATSMNNVYVLDSDLTIVGRIEDLAPGEEIYSARFMGERCYLVTFRKVDPLFVVSLEDPVEPRVLGKLKIPGYSDYLHPYDENHLIGIGKETVEAEEGDFTWYQGVKISLFDVSDVEEPKERAKYEIGDRGTDSPILRDHKALLFDKKRNILAIPVLVAEIDEGKYPGGVPQNMYGDYVWQGVYVFTITENDIVLRGGITHIEDDADFLKSGYYFSSDYTVERSLYIEDVLYTISDKKIKMNSLTDLEEINEVELP